MYLEIRKVKDCWGSYSFVGYLNGKAYTECYDTLEELREQEPLFEEAEAWEIIKLN